MLNYTTDFDSISGSLPLTHTQASAAEAALSVLQDARIAVLTGAGISTDSGIPDYRGAGSPARSPMNFQVFTESLTARQRYWTGSHYGWQQFTSASPNLGHLALTRLEKAGLTSGIITQNVDGLHQRAGTEQVVELHGNMRRVFCLQCGENFNRLQIDELFHKLNPMLPSVTELGEVTLSPDGDSEIKTELLHLVTVPDCPNCGGILKPEVVFFGETVPINQFTLAEKIIAEADAILVVGSSLVVNSGFRLVEKARRRKLPLVVINRGPTRVDAIAAVRLEGGTSPLLTMLSDGLSYGLSTANRNRSQGSQG